MTQQTDTTWRPPPMAAWERLRHGNDRFVAGRPGHPGQDTAKRSEISDRQRPFAIIVGCSDSRVAAEIIFDQGLGTCSWSGRLDT